MEYKLHAIVELKKNHPWGTNQVEIIRLGMDIKIKCCKCGHIVMLKRREFERKLKKILASATESK